MSELDTIKEIKALRKEIRELKALIEKSGVVASPSVPEVTLTPGEVMEAYNMTKDQLRYMRRNNPEIIRTVGEVEVDNLGRSMRRRLRYSKTAIESLIKNPNNVKSSL